jgi:hypothetical protein
MNFRGGEVWVMHHGRLIGSGMFLEIIRDGPLGHVISMAASQDRFRTGTYQVDFGIHACGKDIPAFAVIRLSTGVSGFDWPLCEATHESQYLVLVALAVAYGCEGLLLMGRVQAP